MNECVVCVPMCIHVLVCIDTHECRCVYIVYMCEFMWMPGVDGECLPMITSYFNYLR